MEIQYCNIPYIDIQHTTPRQMGKFRILGWDEEYRREAHEGSQDEGLGRGTLPAPGAVTV